MCDPVTALAAGAMVGGGLLQQGAANAGARAQQRALDANVAVSRSEYDKRNQLSREGSATQLDLDRRGFDEGNTLDAAITNELRNIADTGFRTDLESEGRRITRDADSWIAQLNDIGSAKRGVWTAEDQARADYDAAGAAERARQIGYQGEARGSLAEALRGLSFDASEARRVADTADRSAFTTSAITTPTAAPTGMSGLVAEEMARKAAAAVSGAKTTAAAGAGLDAYAAAGRGGGKILVDLGDRLALIDANSQTSASALPAELMAAVTRRNNSRALGDLLIAQAGERGEGARHISAVRREGEGKVNTKYTDDLGRSAEGAGNRRRQALSDYFTRSIQSEDDFTRGLLTDSSDYEGKMTGLTNYKIANTRAYSPVGTALSTLGQVGMMAGAVGAWDKVGGWLGQAGAAAPTRLATGGFLV